MQTMASILQAKMEMYHKNPEKFLKNKSTEYNKKWNEGVQFFQIAINKDRKKDGIPEASFISVRNKLLALAEVDDLRWFYYCCQKYAKTKDKNGKQNTFSRCFYGALRVK